MRWLFVVVVVALIVGSQADRKIIGDRRRAPSNWLLVRETEQNRELRFIVALKQRNLDILEKKFWSVSDPDSPDYQNFLTIAQITEIVSPSSSAQEVVINWLKEYGITKISNNGDSLGCVATVDVTERLLNANFADYIHIDTNKVLTRLSGVMSIPSSISQYIDFISGLTEFPPPRYNRRPIDTFDDETTAYNVVVPQTIFKMYNIPDSAVGTSGSQGVIEFVDQYYSPTQLQTFAHLTGVTIENPTAERTIGRNNPNSPQIEATLDIQYIAAVGRGVQNWFWIEADGIWLYGFATHLFATDPAPLVASISYGWDEEDQCEPGIGREECSRLGVDSKGYAARVNAEFQKIGVRGISLFVSSGDSGVYGRTDPGCRGTHFNPDFPGASPFITSVGATQVINPQVDLPNKPLACTQGNWACISAGTEVAVSFAQARFASGGGFSFVGAQQEYQREAVDAYLKNPNVKLPASTFYNASGRGYPDIAAFGSNVLIYAGALEPVGGTSASAPIFAGLAALLNSEAIKKTGKPLGFLNQFFYKAAKARPATFFDVTVGDNKCTEAGCFSSCQGFEAAVGWDPVTGLGTPNYVELLAYLNTL